MEQGAGEGVGVGLVERDVGVVQRLDVAKRRPRQGACQEEIH